jgi:hypothetical protein
MSAALVPVAVFLLPRPHSTLSRHARQKYCNCIAAAGHLLGEVPEARSWTISCRGLTSFKPA